MGRILHLVVMKDLDNFQGVKGRFKDSMSHQVARNVAYYIDVPVALDFVSTEQAESNEGGHADRGFH